ncbi:MAG: hypothetical protein HFE44_07895 [Oscillospiraceae bacterium]|nr:hypothetical protein [Oscillospiraceae bacterium]
MQISQGAEELRAGEGTADTVYPRPTMSIHPLNREEMEGGISPAMKYSNGIPNNSRTAAADYTKANLGNAGNGGNSGSVGCSDGTPHTEASASPGYPGIPGGVVIDCAAS